MTNLTIKIRKWCFAERLRFDLPIRRKKTAVPGRRWALRFSYLCPRPREEVWCRRRERLNPGGGGLDRSISASREEVTSPKICFLRCPTTSGRRWMSSVLQVSRSYLGGSRPGISDHSFWEERSDPNAIISVLRPVRSA